jgi:hypothetical protein
MNNSVSQTEEITPIWIPSPGVPLASRILSYIFAILLVIAILREIFIDKTVEITIPQAENEWASYKSELNTYIPYPKTWIIKKNDENSAIIHYPADIPIQFFIEESKTSADLTTEEYNMQVEQLTEVISSFENYQPLNITNIENNIKLYNFSCDINDNSVEGSYCVLTYPGKICVFICISTPKEFSSMQKLMIVMIKKSRG